MLLQYIAIKNAHPCPLHDFSQVDMMVTDTKGQHFVNREKTDKGKFAFTTDNYDVFEICFISRVPANMRGGR